MKNGSYLFVICAILLLGSFVYAQSEVVVDAQPQVEQVMSLSDQVKLSSYGQDKKVLDLVASTSLSYDKAVEIELVNKKSDDQIMYLRLILDELKEINRKL